MGGGNTKNKVKPDTKNQAKPLPIIVQQNINVVENYKKQLEEQDESDSKSISDSDSSESQSESQFNNANKDNKLIDLKSNALINKLNPQQQQEGEKNIGHSLRIQINSKNGSATLQNKFDQESMTKRVRKISFPKPKENLFEDKMEGFKQALSIKSYTSDNKSTLNVNKNNLKTYHHIGSNQLTGSSIFKSTRKVKSNQLFVEDKLTNQKKMMLQSMKNIKRVKENNSDTSSYQSSAYSNDKMHKNSDESPQQKTSPVNTPLSLKKIKGHIDKGGLSPFKRDQIKKFSQKTVKELLEQNIFQQYNNNNSKENFETEQDGISINKENQKQENWLQGSISKISSVVTSEKMIKDSNNRLLNSTKEQKQIESQDLQSANVIDERNTYATSKYFQSNEVTSQNLKTRQELDHPPTNHTSQSTFKKAHIQRDFNRKTTDQSITSLKDLNQNEKRSNAVEGEQDMMTKSKRIKISPNLLQSNKSLKGQNSLQERENEEGSLDHQNQKLIDDEEDDDYLDEDEQIYNNFLKMQSTKQVNNENNQERNDEEGNSDDIQEMEELNDSLLTTYDLGYIDALHFQKSQPHDHEDNDNDPFSKRKKKNKFYLGTELYQKIKRVYIRTTLENKTPVQYFAQKTFKLEWVTGEIQKKNYFLKQLKEKNKRQKNNSQSSSESEAEERLQINTLNNKYQNKKLRDVGGTMFDQELYQSNPIRNAVSDMEDSQLFVNRKHYIKDRRNLEKFQVAVSCRKGSKEDDLPIQDDYLFYKDHLTTIYSVLDGHGPYGHHISNITYRLLLTKFLSSINCYVNPELALRNLFRNMTKDVQKIIQNEGLNCNQYISGVSCTFVVKRFNTLIVSNVGDTRAVVFKKNVNLNKKDKILAIQLTDDHIPSNIEERKRIYHQCGEVKRSQDFNEKVFVRGRDYPALHITRSVGDLIAQEIGVTSDPCIKSYDIDQNDNFLLVGTASIFDLLSIEDLWSIISPFDTKNVMEASRYLQARIKTVQKQQPQLCQDSTFILTFL